MGDWNGLDIYFVNFVSLCLNLLLVYELHYKEEIYFLKSTPSGKPKKRPTHDRIIYFW